MILCADRFKGVTGHVPFERSFYCQYCIGQVRFEMAVELEQEEEQNRPGKGSWGKKVCPRGRSEFDGRLKLNESLKEMAAKPFLPVSRIRGYAKVLTG